MIRKNTIVAVLFVFALISVAARPAFSQSYAYTVTDLGTLPGGILSEARAINNSGQVVGNAVVNGQWHGFIYSDGVMTDIGTLPTGMNSSVFAINAFGEVVGTADVEHVTNQFQPTMESHAILYQNGQLIDLGSLPGSSDSPMSVLNKNFDNRAAAAAYGVNDRGVAVGMARGTVMIYQDGVMRGINSQNVATALDINNLGQMVGQTRSGTEASPIVHAFLMDGLSVRELGADDPSHFSYAAAINDYGTVVGGSAPAGGPIRAFAYTNGEMTDLGVLPGHLSSVAMGVNNRGVIVGSGDNTAFVYKDGVMSDLNDLIPPGFQLVYAVGINDSGQIIATGFTNHQERALLLTPIQ
jgi:probable HAF family extracellular repeat protein